MKLFGDPPPYTGTVVDVNARVFDTCLPTLRMEL